MRQSTWPTRLVQSFSGAWVPSYFVNHPAGGIRALTNTLARACFAVRLDGERVWSRILLLRNSALLFLAIWLAQPGAPAAEAPLTRIGDVRSLSREEAAKSRPVQVRGVVQGFRPAELGLPDYRRQRRENDPHWRKSL